MISTFGAFAIAIQFVGPCSDVPLLETQLKRHFKNVGVATVETLNDSQIPYQGNEQGLNSAFGTPTGLGAIEVISDTEMRSYGWCFKVNDKIPENYANQIPLSSGVNKIEWYFGFAHYLNGEWVSQCEPAYKIRPQFLCH